MFALDSPLVLCCRPFEFTSGISDSLVLPFSLEFGISETESSQSNRIRLGTSELSRKEEQNLCGTSSAGKFSDVPREALFLIPNDDLEVLDLVL
jgi:hypothetical protein